MINYQKVYRKWMKMGNLGTWLANIIEHPAFTLFGILFGGGFFVLQV
jgi:hypothetical protein